MFYLKSEKEKIMKKIYIHPQAVAVEFELQSVIAQSIPTDNSGTSPGDGGIDDDDTGQLSNEHFGGSWNDIWGGM